MATLLELDCISSETLILKYGQFTHYIPTRSSQIKVQDANGSKSYNLDELHEPKKVEIAPLGKRLRIVDGMSGKPIHVCEVINSAAFCPPSYYSTVADEPKSPPVPILPPCAGSPLFASVPRANTNISSSQENLTQDDSMLDQISCDYDTKMCVADPPMPAKGRERSDLVELISCEELAPNHIPAKDQDFLDKTIKSLLRRKQFYDYSEPVDYVALSELGGKIWLRYPDIIKRPMDLSTISRRIRSREYHMIYQVTADVLLMTDNAVRWFEFVLQETRCRLDEDVVEIGKALRTLWIDAASAHQKGTTPTLDQLMTNKTHDRAPPTGPKQSLTKHKPTNTSTPEIRVKRSRDDSPSGPHRTKKTKCFNFAYLKDYPRDAAYRAKAPVTEKRSKKSASKRSSRRANKPGSYSVEDYCHDVFYDTDSTDHSDCDYDGYDDGCGFVNDDDGDDVDDEEVDPFASDT